MKQVTIINKSENYTVSNIGTFDEIVKYDFYHKAINATIPGKVFLGKDLDLTSMEISFQTLSAGKEIPINHRHVENEEVYIVLKGIGKFILDGEEYEISEGSIIKVGPAVSRRWLNEGNEDLLMLCIQGKSESLNKFYGDDGFISFNLVS